MNNLKLGVEVISAHNLIAKDGKSSCNAYVELHFDDQKFRTTIKENDLNPVWNETLYFNISNPNNLSNLKLDAYTYHNSTNHNKSFLGKVCITGTSFVPYSDAIVLHHPFEKKGIFSHVKGELGLKVFVTNDPNVRSSNALPTMESLSHTQDETPVQQVLNFAQNQKDFRNTLHHLPNPNHTQSQPVDFSLKETKSPFLGGRVMKGKPSSTHDLVEPMHYLFVRVVKARDLPNKDASGSLDPYIEVRVGNYKGVTKYLEKNQTPEWNSVFAFSKDRLQSSTLEVVVMDKDMVKDDFVGNIRFNLQDVPTCVPPDSPLAPEWYCIEDEGGEKEKGEIMLAIWFSTQADEAFPDAWHSDTICHGDSSSNIRSKVYHFPRLWYVRVNVIEAQDLVLTEKNRFPDVYVKAQIGSQIMKTKPIHSSSMNAMWNEDLMFVAAEPFEDVLTLTVEDRLGQNKDEILGKVHIPLNTVYKRADDRIVHSQWYNLQNHSSSSAIVDEHKRDKFSSRLHLRVCLDGGYHVLDESTYDSSDLRPTTKQLWKPSIGILELGILNAGALPPMKTREGRGTSDTYCVAKYGRKWIRTRTIMDSLSPRYNEQYTWEVYDPTTVLTIGVFDNSQVGHKDTNENNKDMRIGKIKIRISTIETGRVYTHSYPLLVLHTSGVKKMGELHLAIRFSCTSMSNMMFLYSRPLLPKMHYVRPLTATQLDILRHQAVTIVVARLECAEPPLRKEIVEYMTDANLHLWSIRRSKANFFRLMTVINGLVAIGKWFGEVCLWKNSITTALVHVLFIVIICFPEFILPTAFLYMLLLGLWNYRFRPKSPPYMNTKISCTDGVHPEELDEEFDTFPSSRNLEVIRYRYDRLRCVAGRIQTVVGDIASQGERILALLSWRDPRATFIFLVFCLLAAVVFYATPFQVLAVIMGFYAMRHPKFRHKLPSAPLNFFRRLPARTDIIF